MNDFPLPEACKLKDIPLWGSPPPDICFPSADLADILLEREFSTKISFIILAEGAPDTNCSPGLLGIEMTASNQHEYQY